MRAARGLEAAGVNHVQLLLLRGEANAPLNQLPPGFGIRASLDVPRVLHIELTPDRTDAAVRGRALFIGDRELPGTGRAMDVVEFVGAAGDAFVVDGNEAERVLDLVRVLDPVRALLQRPVKVSTARPAQVEERRTLTGDGEVVKEADGTAEVVPVKDQ